MSKEERNIGTVEAFRSFARKKDLMSIILFKDVGGMQFMLKLKCLL